MSEANSSVKSAQRAIEILKVFADIRTPLSQATLLSVTKYPQSSMTAILKTLSANGILHYNVDTRKYFPTMVVKDMGSWIEDLTPAYAPIYGHIALIMRKLRVAIGETVALGVQNDIHLLYLRSMESDHVVRYHVKPGEQRFLFESSMGWLLLSRQDPRKVERIYRRTPLETREAIGSLADVEAKMADLRDADHCYLPNVPPRAGTVAMLIPGFFNRTQLVLGVGGFIERIEPRVSELTALMRDLIEKQETAGGFGEEEC